MVNLASQDGGGGILAHDIMGTSEYGPGRPAKDHFHLTFCLIKLSRVSSAAPLGILSGARLRTVNLYIRTWCRFPGKGESHTASQVFVLPLWVLGD